MALETSTHSTVEFKEYVYSLTKAYMEHESMSQYLTPILFHTNFEALPAFTVQWS